MGNKNSHVPSKRSNIEDSDRCSSPSSSASHEKNDKKQCPALSVLTELLPTLINSDVQLDDLIDVAETFVKLLKQIKRLQNNASGQRDYAADDESLYAACFPKTNGYRYASSCYIDRDIEKTSNIRGGSIYSGAYWADVPYELDGYSMKSWVQDASEDCEDNSEKSSEQDDSEKWEDDVCFHVIRKVASAPEIRPDHTSMSSDDMLDNLFNANDADEVTSMLSGSTSSTVYEDDDSEKSSEHCEDDEKTITLSGSTSPTVYSTPDEDSDDSAYEDDSEESSMNEMISDSITNMIRKVANALEPGVLVNLCNVDSNERTLSVSSSTSSSTTYDDDSEQTDASDSE